MSFVSDALCKEATLTSSSLLPVVESPLSSSSSLLPCVGYQPFVIEITSSLCLEDSADYSILLSLTLKHSWKCSSSYWVKGSYLGFTTKFLVNNLEVKYVDLPLFIGSTPLSIVRDDLFSKQLMWDDSSMSFVKYS